MIKILIWLVIVSEFIIAFSVWCCLRVGAQADKDIEKLELERPDLIQLQSKENT